MKKRKMRRFAEGGLSEDEDKAEGLRRSAGEKVGFLRRLRMGNIDDPESEAYKQFGAGRGRADRAAPAAPAAAAAAAARPPAMAATPAALEVDELEEVNKRAPLDTTPGPRAMPTGPAAAAPASPRGPSIATSRGTNRATMPPDNRPSMSTSRGANRAPMPARTTASDEGSADIPGAGPYKAPASEGRMMGETERNVRNALNAVGGIGRLVGPARAAKAAPSAGGALAEAETPLIFLGKSGARNVTPAERIGTAPKALPGPRSAEAADTGTKAVGLSKESVNRAAAKSAMEGQPRSKAEKELLESTLRGRAGRAQTQATRAERKRKSAEALEEAKPVLQASKKKPSPRSRTRDEDADYELRAKGGRIQGYAKGGSVRGGGCEQRGLRKCKVV